MDQQPGISNSTLIRSEQRLVRTIWISDLHLGTRHAKTAYLLDFLRDYESEYLFLVGDIFDGWALARSWYWDQTHNDVIQKILRRGRKGTVVTYLPGNHDAFARDYLGLRFGSIDIADEAIHTLADGRRVLIVHGDRFDGIVRYARWLQLLGAFAYGVALTLNQVFNAVRRALGRPYWSLSAFLKSKTKKAVQYVADFEDLVARDAAEHGVDGVVCGHIHQAEMRSIGSVQYLNCGDWVESCTALIEHLDGRLEIVRYPDDALAPPERGQTELFSAGGDGHVGLSILAPEPLRTALGTPEVIRENTEQTCH